MQKQYNGETFVPHSSEWQGGCNGCAAEDDDNMCSAFGRGCAEDEIIWIRAEDAKNS